MSNSSESMLDLETFHCPSITEVADAAYEREMAPRLFKLVGHFEGYDRQFDYLIKGYLPVAGFGLVYGASGTFKSFHALSWAVHVALGREWNGCRVTKSRVLYVAGEGGVGVPRRIKALANRYHEGQAISGLYRLDHPVPFGDVRAMERLVATIKSHVDKSGEHFGLVIIDTLARCFGGDENKTEDMNRFISACDRLKAETGATVLVVHHSGVGDEKRARGSSALRAAADFEYRVERVEEGKPGLILTATKAKDEKEAPAQLFWLEQSFLFTDKDGEDVCSLVCGDLGGAPPEKDSVASGSRPLTPNQQALYQVVRCRMAASEPTVIQQVRDDLISQEGGNARKNFSRWVDACIKKGVLVKRDGSLFTKEAANDNSGEEGSH